MIETVNFKGKEYPAFQINGNAARFIMPFALEFCKGEGVDVGCNRTEWKFPGAHPVDPEINQWHATDFPYENLDYVFSSHCLEHIVDRVLVNEGKIRRCHFSIPSRLFPRILEAME
jgi:hypothetical protein